MGQYFIVVNLTRKVSVKPAFANWKIGEFDIGDICGIMSWSLDDVIFAIGDEGSCFPLTEEARNVEENGDVLIPSDVEEKYICSYTDEILISEYDEQEHTRRVKIHYNSKRLEVN